MKKALSILLVLMLLLPIAALADPITIDPATATRDELLAAQSAIQDALASLDKAEGPAVQPASEDAIVITGTGTNIYSDIEVPFAPARIILNTGENMEVTLTGNDYEYTMYGAGSTVCPTVNTLTVLAEGSEDWTLTISPIVDGGKLEASGTGPYISDFFTLEKPFIAKISVDASKAQYTYGDSFDVYLECVEEDGYIYNDSLLFEYVSKSDTLSKDVIIKPAQNISKYFIVVDCDPGVAWTVASK